MIERLRYEAAISRPWQTDRLNALADEFAAALAQQPETEESRTITALSVTLFGVQCYLPASIARSVEERCREAQGWRPIETVPNTNEVVLFCDKRGNRWNQCAHSWDIPECGLPASLWMPLPAAPERGEGE